MKTSVCVLQKFFHRLNVLQANSSVLFSIKKHGMVKFICAVFLCVLMSSMMFAQAADSVSNSDYNKSVESEMLIQSSSEDSSNMIPAKQPSSIWLFVRMIFVLAIVIACIYGVVFFLKKSMKATTVTDDPYMKVVSSISLAPGKFVYIVTVNSIGYILGVTDNSINLIGQLDDADLINAMNLNADKNTTNPPSKNFETLLSFFNVNKNNKTSSFKDTSDLTIKTLREQRERLTSEEENYTEDNL